MVTHRYFDHKRSGGPSFVQRIRRTGYLRGARKWVVGENIAWAEAQHSTPGGIVKAWMASPHHKENILDGTYEEIGIGLAVGRPPTTGFSFQDNAQAVTVTTDFGFRSGTFP
jgi:uncharacterized protein YkwD